MDEKFSFGTRLDRILGAEAVLAGVMVGLAGALGGGAGWLWIFFPLAGWALWGLLVEAYEVDISAGNVKVSGVLRIVEFSAAEVSAVVRRERLSNGSLHSVRVEYGTGSVSLPGREALFVKFRDLNPSALVTSETYDDTSD